MNGLPIIYGFCCLLLMGASPASGQNTQLYGTIPGILLRSKFNKLNIALAINSEINVVERNTEQGAFPTEVINLNLESLVSFDLNPNINLAGAFLYRFRDPFTGGGTELRPWQQITLIHRLNQYRLRNRLRLESRWVKSSNAEDYNYNLRVRYRFSTDFPLEGERLDDKEFYLNLSTEVLLTPTTDRPFYFWESRTYAGLGYRLNNRFRLEPALDFRTRRVNDLGARRHILFMRFLWIAKI